MELQANAYVPLQLPIANLKPSADGVYRVRPVSRKFGTTDWQNCLASSNRYVKIKREGGKSTLLSVSGVNGTELTFATVGETGVATLWLDHAAVVPEGLTAYSASRVENNDLLLFSIIDGIIPSNTGVVIKGAAGRYAFRSSNEEGMSVESLLVGQEEEAPLSENGYKFYTLTGSADNLSFSLDQEDGSIEKTVSNRAYLRLGSADVIKNLKLCLLSGPDAVFQPSALSTTSAVYNLAGQRVGSGYKGIVIRGGKKLLKY